MTTTASPAIIEPVGIRADGVTLAGNLYLPSNVDDRHAVPGVIVTGTWTSIKEQMADRYAARIAEHGIAGLSFDFTGFGASGGEPREVESPRQKAQDMRHAVSMLVEHPAIDADRVGALAICASAGYAVAAAIEDPRMRALALVAPWLHNADLVRSVYGGEDGVQGRVRAGTEARRRYEQAGVVEYVPAADADHPDAAMPMAIDFYRNPERGAVPGWPNRFAVMAWPDWLTFDPIALAPQVAVPTLIVHSEDAAIPEGAGRFYEGLAVQKEILWTSGDQYAFYDQEPNVSYSVGNAASHFARYL